MTTAVTGATGQLGGLVIDELLARGIAAGLGVQGRVSSPTFIIARDHRAASPGRPAMIPATAVPWASQSSRPSPDET